MNDLKPDQWQSCYDDGWQGDIIPGAFSHPAKFSHGLIHRIYKHAKEMGWVKPGDYILDPFGGVALGGLDALSMGLNWIGIELEQKFVILGQQNIELWQRELAGWPNLGTAEIVQGDSRRLRDVIREASLIVSSPPYSSEGGIGHHGNKATEIDIKKGLEMFAKGTYGNDPANLKNLPEGNLQDVIEKADLVVSSPPFSIRQPTANARPGENIELKDMPVDHYGHTPGNLANMKEGNIDLVVSSPPYADQPIQKNSGSIDRKKQYKTYQSQGGGASFEAFCKTQELHSGNYGQSPGQLGSMKEGNFDLCVSSPP